MLKSPFTGRFKQCCNGLIVVEINPLYPNFSLFGWLSGIGVMFVWGVTAWLIPCWIIGCTGIFWSSHFYYWMNKKGLRKAGYSGSMDRVKLTNLIKEVIM